MLPRLRRCWRLGESNHPYRPLAVPSQALDVVPRTRYESLGGQHFIVATILGLSQERCCETTRADFSVAWLPPASPLPSFSARMCLGTGWASRETVTLASICPSWTCHFPSRIRVTSLSIASWHSPPVAYLVALSTTRRPHCIIQKMLRYPSGKVTRTGRWDPVGT